jgi:hypothetical protein
LGFRVWGFGFGLGFGLGLGLGSCSFVFLVFPFRIPFLLPPTTSAFIATDPQRRSVNHIRKEPLVLPQPHANFIWYCAWLSLCSAWFALSRPGTGRFAIVPVSVFATSLNYWRHPLRDSWRRFIDIAVVLSCLAYQSYVAFSVDIVSSEDNLYRQMYFYLTGSGMACFVLSDVFGRKGLLWPATYAHASIHLLANIANIMLYKSIN